MGCSAKTRYNFNFSPHNNLFSVRTIEDCSVFASFVEPQKTRRWLISRKRCPKLNCNNKEITKNKTTMKKENENLQNIYNLRATQKIYNELLMFLRNRFQYSTFLIFYNADGECAVKKS